MSQGRERRHRPDTANHDDLVKCQFTGDGPDRAWFRDITQHRVSDGWDYCCAVIDAWSRRVVGWSIADHMRSELGVDALEMARWQRSPDGTIVYADRSVHYTSWVLGHRLRAAGLLSSMGRVASSVDNAHFESFWSTTQREVLDRQLWSSRVQLASAIFEWIEGWYNPHRRHATLGRLSPHEYEALHTAAEKAA